jgi:hypothetical protein
MAAALTFLPLGARTVRAFGEGNAVSLAAADRVIVAGGLAEAHGPIVVFGVDEKATLSLRLSTGDEGAEGAVTTAVALARDGARAAVAEASGNGVALFALAGGKIEPTAM